MCTMNRESYYLAAILTLITVAGTFPYQTVAQTCSCAGVPLLSSQDMANSRAGQWNFSLTYEYHDVSDLYSNDKKLENRSFQRSTQSLLAEVNYGITDRLLATGLLSSTRKVRKSGPSLGNEVTATGIGDGLVMLKYTLHQNTIQEQYQLTVGGGTKIPLGPTDLSGPITALSPDMQPSTGSWDIVGWGQISKTFLPTTTLNAFATVSYRHTGTHDFSNLENFKFGNQLVAKLGVSNSFLDRFEYTLIGKYRHVSIFEFNGNERPNTGGDWINVIPGLNYTISSNMSARIAGEFPVCRYLNGTQSTTNYSASVSLFYSF